MFMLLWEHTIYMVGDLIALVNSGRKKISVRFHHLILLCVECWLW